MERLTQWIDENTAIPRVDLRRCGHERCTTQLARYEDTGLTPGQIRELKERDTAKAPEEINLSEEEFEILRFADSATFRCGNEYVSLYMGEDEATREYKIVDDGWIPVEERLPEVDEDTEETIEDDDCPEYIVTIRGASESTTLKYSPDGTWFDENGYVYDVIAWRPLPEPYRPERSEE